MEESGGAQARLEAVEVIDVQSVETEGSGGFSVRVVWTVGRTMTHFGHRHFRQNRYDARVSLVPDQDPKVAAAAARLDNAASEDP